jgi:peptidyl-prolyl cis-trans isomerase SurA
MNTWQSLLKSISAVIILMAFHVQAEMIDRLLVAVNGKVITEGDLRLANSLNKVLMLGKVAGGLKEEDEIQRLVDLELLRQELESFSDVTGVEEQVEAQIKELENAYAQKGGLASILQKLGLQESELKVYLRLQVSILKLIDFRFRPFVGVTEDEIEQYYRTKFVPQVQASGASVPALEAVSSKIKTILIEEKVDSALNQWLQDSRRRSKIEYFDKGELQPGGAKR